MGFLSDTEWDLNDQQDDIETPPGSPNLAAAQAQAIAANIPSDFIELNGRPARDYAALCCEEFGLMDVDQDDVLKTSQLHSHLISVRQYARVVALDRRVQRMIVESFLDSTDFKDHITR
ncbi:hypothetical protein FS749_013825 [Ceratobasidium sp. UAMH 11750]|nr:hypothetical protein FS749_013825 [Ceratobasidium sp. UAMH 11750]